MIVATGETNPDLWLFGVVRGLAREALPTVERIARLSPKAVGLALSPEEVKGLEEHFAGADAEEVVPLTTLELAEAVGLCRFGEVRVPNPTYIALLEWGRVAGVAVRALDAPDDETAEMFTDHIGYVELVRRTLRERRVARDPPAAGSAEAYTLAVERELSPGSGSVGYRAARDAYLGRSALDLAREQRPVAIVVDFERFRPVGAAIGGIRAAN